MANLNWVLFYPKPVEKNPQSHIYYIDFFRGIIIIVFAIFFIMADQWGRQKKFNHGITRKVTDYIMEWILFLSKHIRQDSPG